MLLVLVFVSLAANLLVAGFVVSRFAGPGPAGEIDRIVLLGIRAFPPEIQADIMDQMGAYRDEFRSRLEAVRAARQQMFEDMRAEPFDRTRLDRTFTDMRDKTNEIQAIGQRIIADAIANAPPDVRARFKPSRGPFT
jgi:hypothetical protein